MNGTMSNTALIYSMYAIGKKPSGGSGEGGGTVVEKSLYELALEIGYPGSESDFNRDFNNVLSNKLISPDGSAKVTVKNAETIIKGLVDPVDLLDAVNLQTLNKYIEATEKKTQGLVDDLNKKIDELGACSCDPEVLNQLVKDFQELQERFNNLVTEVGQIKQSVADLKTELETKITELRDELVKLINEKEQALNVRIDALEAKHDKDIQDLLDLNTSLNQKVVDLEKKHDEDIKNLQNNIVSYLSGYLKEELPKMVEEEVKKYLEANPPSGDCGCNIENWPPDVIDGNVWPETTKDTILIWDNGQATSTDFDYIMADLWDAAIIEDDDRIAIGGDSNPNDDLKDVLTFEQWLERLNKTNIYEGGTASEKNLLETQYYLYLGGSASSEW